MTSARTTGNPPGKGAGARRDGRPVRTRGTESAPVRAPAVLDQRCVLPMPFQFLNSDLRRRLCQSCPDPHFIWMPHRSGRTRTPSQSRIIAIDTGVVRALSPRTRDRTHRRPRIPDALLNGLAGDHERVRAPVHHRGAATSRTTARIRVTTRTKTRSGRRRRTRSVGRRRGRRSAGAYSPGRRSS
ncbi:hypothetical protein FIBSPDRAFT_492826 [Athelia psychrophila]|uniref:Uncharacterized protein n=1 Tax=Athelia psychrophila TaxID=1759441 RepID=A0A166KQ44_9AGAM|nr:hypothetical protein FIBSPDRAFT_492826 [Fibularhizoctonia sp. CBS 109695]